MTMVLDRAAADRIDTRDPPANIEVEQALLGAVLVNNDAYRRVCEIIETRHFHEAVHRRIWEIATGLIEKGSVADTRTIATYLGKVDLGGLTAIQYVARLAAEATTIVNAPDYARTIRDLWIRREMVKLGRDILEVAYDAPVEATSDSLLAEIESNLERLRPTVRGSTDFLGFDTAAHEAILAAETAYKRAGMLVGHSTGLPRLDEALGGLQPSDLIIVAGRPGMGKTAIATNIAYAVALTLQARRAEGEKTGIVGFSSLEMSAAQLAMRIIADRASVPVFKIRKGHANEVEHQRMIDAQRELRGLPLEIDPHGNLTIASLRTRVRSLAKRRGLELLIVDYLQLLAGSERRREANRVQEVTEITMGLKALAKELNVPVIALSQLSRRVEERDDKRPMLSDLRESGSIEQDADVVAFVYREEYYLKKVDPKIGTDRYLAWERDMHRATGVGQVIIGKNRHGPESTVTLGFQSAYTRFINEPEEREEMPAAERAPRKKAISLPKEATIALGILRSLTIAHAIENKGDLERVPRGVRPVDYLLWREETAKALLDPSFEEKDAVALMKTRVVPPLMEADLVNRGGSATQAFAWLTERGQG